MSLQGTLFLLPGEGGRAVQLTDPLQDAYEPAWSADGSSIVFHSFRSGGWDIWRIRKDGSDAQRLTNDRFDDREPQFAPDGDSVVFSSDRSGSYDIWSLSLTSGLLTNLTQSDLNEHSPAWSPDGGTLSYAVAYAPGQERIVIRSTRGGETRVLVTESGVIGGIAWDQDGKQLSYQVSGRLPDGHAFTQLKIVDVATGASKVRSRPESDIFPFRSSWTDQGLVYAADGGIKQLAGEHEQDIPFTATFQLQQRGPYRRVRRSYKDSSQRQALGIFAPALSPDARTIAFGALGELWLWQWNTKQLTQLTDDSAEERTPAWSRDGKNLAYVSDRGGDALIWIYDIEARSARKLESERSGFAFPSWSADGKTLATFCRIPGDPLASELLLIEVATGKTTKLAKSLAAQPLFWSGDGKTVSTSTVRPVSTRYREGINQLVVIDVQTGQVVHAIAPLVDRSPLDLTPVPATSALSYVLDGVLWQMPPAASTASASALQLTDELTDSPSWDSTGATAIYLSGGRLKRLRLDDRSVADITPPLPWRPRVPKDSWILRAGRVFDGRSDRYLQKVDITVEGNLITKLSPWDQTTKLPVVDASNKTVMPGLFDMHAHMGTASELYGRTWLAFGVTSVRDPGSHPYLAKSRQEMWASGRSAGPRALLAGYLMDGSRVFYGISEDVSTPAGVRKSIERLRKLKMDFAKTYVRLSSEQQAYATRLAHEAGLPVTSHELFAAAAFGVDQVEHIGGTSRRGYSTRVTSLGRSYADNVALPRAAGMGATVTIILSAVPTLLESQPDLLRSRQFEFFYGDSTSLLRSRFGRGDRAYVDANARYVRRLADSGVTLATGTDSPYIPSGAGLHGELRSLTRAGLTPYEALRAATLDSAILAGVDRELGSIEPGKLADLVVVDGDPLADIRDADNIDMVVLNGERRPLDSLLQQRISW